jgi:DNA-binding GntR family transcriptional regulator
MTPPKYRQIADDLRARIESGEYPPGARLPTKAELMTLHHVALSTVDHAIEELRQQGFAETVQGVGMFARQPTAGDEGQATGVDVSQQLADISQELRRLGERVGMLEKTVRARPGDER